jgi:acetyl esterase/lipase
MRSSLWLRLGAVFLLLATLAWAAPAAEIRLLPGDGFLTRNVTRADVSHKFIRPALSATWIILRNSGEALVRGVSSIRLWGPAWPRPAGALEVQEVLDVAYRDDPKADPIRHRLDLFLPKGKKDFPVVVLVHGGGWIIGDNRCCGLYTSLGDFLASQGIGTVVPNYRLSPRVQHPAHIQDVARAVAWTRRNIARYGGNPKHIYLLGHSAGGHLVSLLATDESYLKAEGLTAGDIKGVITVSGVYHIPDGGIKGTLGGSGPRALRIEQIYPLRGKSSPPPKWAFPGIPARLDPYGIAFGYNPKERAKASPLTHVRRGLPPFMILTAANDLPTLPEMADEFHQALRRAGCNVQLRQIKERNHNSVLFSAIHPDDPTAQAVLQFVGQAKKK